MDMEFIFGQMDGNTEVIRLKENNMVLVSTQCQVKMKSGVFGKMANE